MENLLTVELLASKIHKSVTSIRSDVTRNPQSLPPICRLPGTKRLLWREEDVVAWVARHVVGVKPAPLKNSPIASSSVAKRGRPTKAAQIARQRQQTIAIQGLANPAIVDFHAEVPH